MSEMWSKTSEELVRILGVAHGDTSAYGDWGLHVVGILQAKVAEESAIATRKLVHATWFLVIATLVVALGTVVTVWQVSP